MIKTILFVGIGGFTGSILRYLTGIATQKIFVSSFFPTGTFIVNISGSFLIGIFVGLAQKYTNISTDINSFLVIGLCGGFTTYSSFAFENIKLLQKGQTGLFLVYSTITFILCLIAVYLGLKLSK